MNPYQHAAALLPKARTPPSAKPNAQGHTRRPASVLHAVGAPSLRLVRAQGGVRAELTRRIPYADLLTDDELKPLQVLAARAKRRAESLSQGGLSLRVLAGRGHPYGHGARAGGGRRGGLGRVQGNRRGVSNMDVVNRQTGALAGAWSSELVRGKDGVRIVLANSAEHSSFVALGTPRMKRHGPFLSALQAQIPAVNGHAARLARIARARAKEMEGL